MTVVRTWVFPVLRLLVWAVIAGAAYGVARPAGAPYARREATRWQGTQRTASGSDWTVSDSNTNANASPQAAGNSSRSAAT